MNESRPIYHGEKKLLVHSYRRLRGSQFRGKYSREEKILLPLTESNHDSLTVSPVA
jgi:hypothetical protein